MKKIIFSIFLFLIFGLALVSATTQIQYSLRSIDQNTKLNVWTNGARGSGSLEVWDGKIKSTFVLTQIGITQNNLIIYNIKETDNDYNTRIVQKYEFYAIGFYDGEYFYIMNYMIPVRNLLV